MTVESGGNKRVIIFDSGIGGLNLLRECAESFEDCTLYYCSDSYNVPYGGKTKEELFSLVCSALDNAVERLRPTSLAIACNTVTAQCIGELRARYPFPVVGIQPAVKPAAKTRGRTLVLATYATVTSGSFLRLVDTYGGGRCTAVACPNLAAYIEENALHLPAVLPKKLLPRAEADGVVLGCTHYAFVKRQISSFYGCPIFDGTKGTADNLAKLSGIARHFQGNSGTADHIADKRPKIVFINGNTVRNGIIFDRLLQGVYD